MTGKSKGNEQEHNLFTALAHPLRRRILRAMIGRKKHAVATPRKLSDDFEEHLSVVSYHVLTLAKCKAIQLVRTERVSGSTQHFYRLSLTSAWARTALRTTED